MGRAVIPGLIDNHMHLLRAAATWLRELRFDGVESRKQAVEMLRARAKAAGPGNGSITSAAGPINSSRTIRSRLRAKNWIRSRRTIRCRSRNRTIRSFSTARLCRLWGLKRTSRTRRNSSPVPLSATRAESLPGVIQGDIPATRPVAAKLPKVAPEQLEASSRALVERHESSGPYLGRRSRLRPPMSWRFFKSGRPRAGSM